MTAGLAGSRNADVSARGVMPGNLEIWLWGLGIFMLTSPFVYQLTGIDPAQEIQRDMSTMRREGSSGVLLYAIRYAVAGLAVLSILPHWKAALGRLPRIWPVLGFALWAAFSLVWTDTFNSSLNGVLALLPLVITGFCIASRLPPHFFARAFICAGVFAAVFSLLYIALLPHFGIHQVSDASQSVHAGAWRGVYPHKNLFGGVMACFAVATLLAGRDVIGSLIFRGGLFVVLVALVLKSQSATAILIVILAPALCCALVVIGGALRVLLLVCLVPIALTILMNIDFIFGLMGRDLTFTGRTSLWELAGDAVARRFIGGYGYASTLYGDFMLELFNRFGLFDPHNGYINVLLSTGMVGFILFVLGVGSAANVARRMFVDGGVRRQGALVIFGVTSAWLIAMLSESQDKPLGAFAALGFVSLALLLYRPRLERHGASSELQRPLSAAGFHPSRGGGHEDERNRGIPAGQAKPWPGDNQVV